MKQKQQCPMNTNDYFVAQATCSIFGNIRDYIVGRIFGIDSRYMSGLANASNGDCSGDYFESLAMDRKELFCSLYELWSLISDSFGLHQIQSNDDRNTVMLLESLLCSGWAYLLVFSACELGQRFSNAFDGIGDTIGQLEWYLLPNNIQKILPGTMQYTQQTSAITFLGSFSCSREQFKKACIVRWYYCHSTDSRKSRDS